MSEPFLAEIKMVAFTFAPRGWALCDGQLLPINQNQALFSLLGTTYGGDGRTTFALPDLRSRTPIHRNQAFNLGSRGGSERHTLSINEMPNHTHQLSASSTTANAPIATDRFLASSAPNEMYGATSNLVAAASASINQIGGGQAHDNMQPFLTLNFIIALQGLFPSPN